jgi:hypothetical protein
VRKFSYLKLKFELGPEPEPYPTCEVKISYDWKLLSHLYFLECNYIFKKACVIKSPARRRNQ